MGTFFEHRIPVTAPFYMSLDIRPKYEAAAEKVTRRMALLDKSLTLSGMRGEEFSAAVKHLFTALDSNGEPVLDSMSAESIAAAAALVGNSFAHIPDRMNWANCDTLVDTAFVTTKEWETLRMLGLGGSDSANIINEGYSTARSVYYDKVGWPGDEENHKPDKGLAYIFGYGHIVEPLVIDEFCRRSGAERVPESRMFCHREYPFLTANIDQIVRMPDGSYCVFEAKTTTFFNKNHWLDGGIPRAYIPQCHKYPLILNDDRISGTYIGCIFGNVPSDFACSFLPRDEEYEKKQLEREVAFWNDYVLAGIEPPLSGNGEKDMATLKKARVPQDKNAPKLDLDPDVYAEKLSAYLRLKKKADEYSGRADTLKQGMEALRAELVSALGANPMARCIVPEEDAPDDEGEYEFIVTNKPKKRTVVDQELLRLSYPDVYAACVTVIPESSFMFNVKMKEVANQ